MSVLAGSNANPSLLTNPLDRVEMMADEKDVDVEAIRERLADWNRFKSTGEGQAICQLADPMINHLQGILSKSFDSFAYPPDVTREILAECRGELRAWNMIKYQRETLKVRLNQLTEEDSKQEKYEEDEKNRKKKLDKFA